MAETPISVGQCSKHNYFAQSLDKGTVVVGIALKLIILFAWEKMMPFWGINIIGIVITIIAPYAVKPQSLGAFAAQLLFVEDAYLLLNLLLSKETKDFANNAQNLHF